MSSKKLVISASVFLLLVLPILKSQAIANHAADLDPAVAETLKEMSMTPTERIRYYTRKIQTSPNDQGSAFYYSYRAQAYEQLHQDRKAIEDYTKAIILEPPAVTMDAYAARAGSYERLGETQKAIDDYTKIISILPINKNAMVSLSPETYTADIYKMRARIYERLGLHQKAEDDYRLINAITINDPETYIRAGDTLCKRGEYQKSVDAYSKAISLAPKDPNAYGRRADAYKQLGQMQKAIDDYSAAIRLTLPPETIAASMCLLQQLDARLKQENTLQLLQQYNRLSEQRSTGLVYYMGRAEVYEKLGQYEKAIADYNTVLSLSPSDNEKGEVYFALGNIYYFHLNQNDKAIENYSKAIALNPCDQPLVQALYRSRGMLYGDLKQSGKAIEDYSKALALDPKDSLSYRMRGNEYLATGKDQKAINDYTKAIDLEPNIAHVYLNRAYAYGSLASTSRLDPRTLLYHKTIADCTKAISLDPKEIQHYIVRARAYIGFGQCQDDQKAIALGQKRDMAYKAAKAKGASPDKQLQILRDPQYAYDYDSHAADSHSLELAIADCTKAIMLDPKNTQAYKVRGYAYSVLGQHQKTIDGCNAAIAIDPSDTSAYSLRADSYNKLGQYQKVIDDCSQVIRIDDKNADAYRIRGEAYRKLGRIETAQQDRNKALSIDPNLKVRCDIDDILVASSANCGNDFIGFGEERIAQGKLPEAEDMFNQAKAYYEEAYGNTDMHLATCFALLGRIQKLQGKDAQARESFTKELLIRAKHPDDTQTFTYHDESPNCEHFYKNGVLYKKIKGNDVTVEIAIIKTDPDYIRTDVQIVNNGAQPVDVLPGNIKYAVCNPDKQELEQVSLTKYQQTALTANTVSPGTSCAGTLCFQRSYYVQSQKSGSEQLQIVAGKTTFIL